jgi:polyisoprenoid-binding protein YceI
MATEIAVQPLSGTYQADPVHSSIGFAVKHSGVSTFRAGFGDVQATVGAGDGGATLEGSAAVESVTITEPPEFRAHVLSPEFFDAERHPRIGFRSSEVELADDGTVKVSGELEIRGVARAVEATGSWAPAPGGRRLALELETTVDRRDFGIEWQMEAPGGGDILGYDVTITVALELIAQED